MPPFMGGMESHCHGLVKALAMRGHDVTLFAAGTSDFTPFVALSARPYEAIYPWAVWRGSEELKAYQMAAFSSGWANIKAGGFDIVHNNSLFPPLIEWAARDGVPIVTSQHVPPFDDMRDYVVPSFGDSSRQLTVTSAHQKKLWCDGDFANVSIVHNGIDIAQWRPAERRHNRLIWYGRITPTKGLREAVQAALQSGKKMDIIGTVEDAEYFAKFVKTNLGEAIHYLGHLSGGHLRQKVASARAVVVTPLWDEPFGLVAAEALASGVPVIAFDRGAMREVVDECGVIVPAGDVAALAAAMARDQFPSPQQCRQRAMQYFSIDTMIADYERCYDAAIGAGSGSTPTAAASSASKTNLLLA